MKQTKCNKMDNLNRSLFSISDEMMSNYFGKGEFEKSLLYNILFKDKLLMNESSYFGSYYFFEHLLKERSGISLFEYANREGIVNPIFKFKNINTLEMVFNNFKSGNLYNKNGYGININLEKERMLVLKIENLSKELPKGKEEYWREASNARDYSSHYYYNTLIKYLNPINEEIIFNRAPNIEVKQKLKEIWTETKDWREDLIQSVSNTHVIDGKEIKEVQRHNIMVALNPLVGFDKDDPIDARKLNYIVNPNIRKKVLHFTNWISRCYHISQSNYMNADINLPYGESEEDIIAKVIFSDSKYNKDIEGISIPIISEIPPLNYLINEIPEKLIDLRKTVGSVYLNNLRKYNNKKTKETYKDVKISFEEYCVKLCEKYSFAEGRLEIRNNITTREDIIEKKVGNIFKSGLKNIKGVDFLSSIFKNGKSIIEIKKSDGIFYNKELIEINLPSYNK